MRYLFIPLIMLIASCRQRDVKTNPATAGPEKPAIINRHSIALLPFKGVSKKVIGSVKAGIENKLKLKVLLLPETNLPANAFYAPRNRYIADSLLVFLRNRKNDQFDKIIGLTSKDISTRKGDKANWGVLGLGACPGISCVISTFRAGEKKTGEAVFLKRMAILALHELGHTYGLPHCPVQSCLMKDAEGKMNLDDGDSYCKECRIKLQAKGIAE
jgi:archaemetzincin